MRSPQSSPRIDPRRAGTIDLLAHSDAILGVILNEAKNLFKGAQSGGREIFAPRVPTLKNIKMHYH